FPPGAMVRRPLPLWFLAPQRLGLVALLLLALGEPLPIDIQAAGDGQSEHLGGSPPGPTDQQGQDDPVVPPGKDLDLLAGTERIVMHARPKRAEPTLAAQGVVAGQHQRPVGTEVLHQQAGEDVAEAVEGPGVVGEETVEAGPVAEADLASGEDAL